MNDFARAAIQACAEQSPGPNEAAPPAPLRCAVLAKQEQNAQERLRQALLRDDADALLRELAQNHSQGPGDAFASELLHFAASCAPRCCELLLAQGRSPQTPDASGLTPLMRACRFGQEQCAGALLRAGADPDAQTPSGNAAVHICALGSAWSPQKRLERSRMLRLLAAAGADLGARNHKGQTPAEILASAPGFFDIAPGEAFSPDAFLEELAALAESSDIARSSCAGSAPKPAKPL